MNVLEILAANKGRQTQARELNKRAGQEDLFKVFALAELISFVAERLGGARRQVEITQPELLLLPELDETAVAKVLRDNPDEVTVCGRTAPVQYSNRSNPVVYIDFRGEQAKDWLRLPASGIRLPGGREVVLYSLIEGYSYYIEALSSKFPAKARECLNAGAWQKFEQSSGKPEIVLPDPAIETSEVPAVREHQYGTCAVAGDALVAFGTVAVRPYHYYTSDPWFEVKWFRDQRDAEATRTQSAEKLSALKRELAEQKVITEAKARAETVKAEVYQLYRNHKGVVGGEVADRLYQLSYDYLPGDLNSLRGWTEGASSVLAQAKQAVAEDEARRNHLEIREVRIDRRGQYRKPELNGMRIDSRESFRFTPNWFWDDLLALVDENGRGTVAFAIFRGEDPLVLAKNRMELEALTSSVEQALKELGGAPTDEAKMPFWRKLEGMRPKRKIVAPPPQANPAPREREQRYQPAPKPASSGSFGLGADAWGALNDLKF